MIIGNCKTCRLVCARTEFAFLVAKVPPYSYCQLIFRTSAINQATVVEPMLDVDHAPEGTDGVPTAYHSITHPAHFGIKILGVRFEQIGAGSLWGESSHVEKAAYLVGAGNFLTVEYVVQLQSETQPSDEQSSIRRFLDGLEGVSLDELIDAVDNFYQANPDKQRCLCWLSSGTD